MSPESGTAVIGSRWWVLDAAENLRHEGVEETVATYVHRDDLWRRGSCRWYDVDVERLKKNIWFSANSIRLFLTRTGP